MVDGNFCEKADGLKQGSITVMSLSRRLYLYIRDPCLDRDSKQSDERVTDMLTTGLKLLKQDRRVGSNTVIPSGQLL